MAKIVAVRMQRVLCILPAGEELEGWSAEQLVGEEVDLLHDVGQPDRKLLPEEDKRGLLTRVGRACSHMRDVDKKEGAEGGSISKHSTLTSILTKLQKKTKHTCNSKSVHATYGNMPLS